MNIHNKQNKLKQNLNFKTMLKIVIVNYTKIVSSFFKVQLYSTIF